MALILHLIPTLAGGGAERQLAMLAAEQAGMGHQVHVGVRQGGVHEAMLRANGVVVHHVGDHRGINPFLLFRIWLLIRRVRPDVVQTWLLQMDLLGGIAALWSHVSWVATERSSAGAYTSTRFRLRVWARTHLFSHASAVVANSAQGVSYWRAQLPSVVKVLQVSNAIDVGAIRAVVGSVHAASSSGGSGVHKLLVVGRLVESKALEVVIEAVRQLPDALAPEVRIIGEGPTYRHIDAMIKQGKLAERVTLYPYSASWWKELADASLLVSMSRYEGQPNVVLEAMASGCPLVVSNIAAHREILDAESALMVPVDDVDALVQALTAALADPGTARVRAQKASAYVEQLTITRAAQSYDAVYKQATKGS